MIIGLFLNNKITFFPPQKLSRKSSVVVFLSKSTIFRPKAKYDHVVLFLSYQIEDILYVSNEQMYMYKDLSFYHSIYPLNIKKQKPGLKVYSYTRYTKG